MNKEQGKAVEPYGFIFGKDDRDPSQDVELARHGYMSYAPIASFYISDRFADIPWPTTEDWEAGTQIMTTSSIFVMMIISLLPTNQPTNHPAHTHSNGSCLSSYLLT